MTAPNPATWPIPSPQEGLSAALTLLGAMVAAGAMDEEHPHILDPTIDTWVDVWVQSARDEHRQLHAAVQQELDTASADEKYAAQNLEDAEGRLAVARRALLDTGIRPEPLAATTTSDPSPDAAPDTEAVRVRTVVQAGDDVPLPERPGARSRFLTIGPWALLAVMAGADAYGFWQTLVSVIRRDTLLTVFFVVGLVIGAVLVAHQIGRLTRQLRDGSSPGARPWIGVMAAAWFTLGVLIWWIRAHPPAVSTDIFASSGAASTGIFGAASSDATTSVPTSGPWVSTWGIASLLLVLYCLTGALAMTHAFRTADERPRQRRLALEAVADGQADVASHRYHVRLAERTRARIAERAGAVSDDRSAEADCYANGRHIKQQIRIDLSRQLGSGSATTAVTDDPVVESARERRTRGDDGPAVPDTDVDHDDQTRGETL